MNVLDTKLPPHHLVCSADKTQRVHVSKANQDWQKNMQDIGCTLGGRARRDPQDATSWISVPTHVQSVCRSQRILRTENPCVECLSQASTTLWMWDMGNNYNRETVCLASSTSSNPSRLSLAETHKQ